MIVGGKALSIPRGVKKEHLKDNGMAKTIEFFRYMNVEEVNDVLRKAFPEILSTEFLFLKPTRNNMLKVAEHQAMDGNDIFEIAKGGSLYLKLQTPERKGECSQVPTSTAEIKHDDNEPSDNELPAPPVSTVYTKEAIATLLQKSYETVKRLQVCDCYNALYVCVFYT